MLAESNDFKLERYKYILQQIHFLNENIHKHLALFQGLSTVILGGIVAIFVNWKKLGIDAETAQTGIYALLGLLCLLALFVILYVFSGIFSWLDYREEEADLLDEMVAIGYRARPKVKNLWRWHESWLVVSIVVFVITIVSAVQYWAIPLIQ